MQFLLQLQNTPTNIEVHFDCLPIFFSNLNTCETSFDKILLNCYAKRLESKTQLSLAFVTFEILSEYRWGNQRAQKFRISSQRGNLGDFLLFRFLREINFEDMRTLNTAFSPPKLISRKNLSGRMDSTEIWSNFGHFTLRPNLFRV